MRNWNMTTKQIFIIILISQRLNSKTLNVTNDAKNISSLYMKTVKTHFFLAKAIYMFVFL